MRGAREKTVAGDGTKVGSLQEQQDELANASVGGKVGGANLVNGL